jgi:CDP-diacylglycerol--serine O-phosphatidyltransferase
MTPQIAGKPPRRGIYLLPNLITTGALLSGYYAIVSAIGGHFGTAATAVFVAGVLDGMDGRIARLTNTQSEFGVQYDSLSDLVSFGLAPALVMYMWALQSLHEFGPVAGKLGWAASFLYAACAALRLARFNAQIGQVDKRYFIGLASPAAAALLMSFVWTFADLEIPGRNVRFAALGVTLLGAGLMVSRLRYASFKSRPESDRVPFLWIVAALGIIVAIVVLQERVLVLIAVAYALSGPAMWVMGRRKRGELAPPAAAASEPAQSAEDVD